MLIVVLPLGDISCLRAVTDGNKPPNGCVQDKSRPDQKEPFIQSKYD